MMNPNKMMRTQLSLLVWVGLAIASTMGRLAPEELSACKVALRNADTNDDQLLSQAEFWRFCRLFANHLPAQLFLGADQVEVLLQDDPVELEIVYKAVTYFVSSSEGIDITAAYPGGSANPTELQMQTLQMLCQETEDTLQTVLEGGASAADEQLAADLRKGDEWGEEGDGANDGMQDTSQGGETNDDGQDTFPMRVALVLSNTEGITAEDVKSKLLPDLVASFRETINDDRLIALIMEKIKIAAGLVIGGGGLEPSQPGNQTGPGGFHSSVNQTQGSGPGGAGSGRPNNQGGQGGSGAGGNYTPGSRPQGGGDGQPSNEEGQEGPGAGGNYTQGSKPGGGGTVQPNNQAGQGGPGAGGNSTQGSQPGGGGVGTPNNQGGEGRPAAGGNYTQGSRPEGGGNGQPSNEGGQGGSNDTVAGHEGPRLANGNIQSVVPRRNVTSSAMLPFNSNQLQPMSQADINYFSSVMNEGQLILVNSTLGSATSGGNGGENNGEGRPNNQVGQGGSSAAGNYTEGNEGGPTGASNDEGDDGDDQPPNNQTVGNNHEEGDWQSNDDGRKETSSPVGNTTGGLAAGGLSYFGNDGEGNGNVSGNYTPGNSGGRPSNDSDLGGDYGEGIFGQKNSQGGQEMSNAAGNYTHGEGEVRSANGGYGGGGQVAGSGDQQNNQGEQGDSRAADNSTQGSPETRRVLEEFGFDLESVAISDVEDTECPATVKDATATCLTAYAEVNVATDGSPESKHFLPVLESAVNEWIETGALQENLPADFPFKVEKVMIINEVGQSGQNDNGDGLEGSHGHGNGGGGQGGGRRHSGKPVLINSSFLMARPNGMTADELKSDLDSEAVTSLKRAYAKFVRRVARGLGANVTSDETDAEYADQNGQDDQGSGWGQEEDQGSPVDQRGQGKVRRGLRHRVLSPETSAAAAGKRVLQGRSNFAGVGLDTESADIYNFTDTACFTMTTVVSKTGDSAANCITVFGKYRVYADDAEDPKEVYRGFREATQASISNGTLDETVQEVASEMDTPVKIDVQGTSYVIDEGFDAFVEIEDDAATLMPTPSSTNATASPSTKPPSVNDTAAVAESTDAPTTEETKKDSSSGRCQFSRSLSIIAALQVGVAVGFVLF